jgi:hypothetical protein
MKIFIMLPHVFSSFSLFCGQAMGDSNLCGYDVVTKKTAQVSGFSNQTL